LVLTLLGVAALQGTSLEEKMAGNARDGNMAFEAAEAALRDAEMWLDGEAEAPFPRPDDGCDPCDSNHPVWELSAPGDPVRLTTDEWTRKGRQYGYDYPAGPPSKALPGVAEQPRYLIAEWEFVRDSLTVGIGAPKGRHFYQVSAHGRGGTTAASTVLQSTYAKRYD
jgi:type IV pilus assembly protein PilX